LVGRQDRKTKAKSSDRGKLTAKLLETAGATRVMTMDLHADQIQVFEKSQLITFRIYYSRRKFRIGKLDHRSPDMGFKNLCVF
jgi:ribose-phosphate pyrophosphokinase